VIVENKTRTYYLLYSIKEFFTKWSRIPWTNGEHWFCGGRWPKID